MKFRRQISVLFVLLIVLLIPIAVLGASRAGTELGDVGQQISGEYRGVSTAERFDISPPLRLITPIEPKPGLDFEIPERSTGLEGQTGKQDVDPIVQSFSGPGLIPDPIVSFDGPPNVSFVSPPDPVGDVGPNHYVAMSNLSFAIYDKAGTLLYGPALNNTLWSGFGGDCQTDNSGDPIVLYDRFADR